MSWASRRKASYITGVMLFFAVVLGVPLAYLYFSTPPSCHDGIQNQGETAIDKGGPCLALDPNTLQPHALLWARAFKVRDGMYNAVAYVENPNKDAGVPAARYKFSLYDSQNALIAEQTGTTFIMPGGITPIFASRIDTGNRVVVHTYFELQTPLDWERMSDTAASISIDGKALSDETTAPRITANAHSAAVEDIPDASFVAVAFDANGNAIAASQPATARFVAGSSIPLIFTWSDPFAQHVSRIDIIPVAAPTAAKGL
ncbi:MAG: hypothetical protein KGJ31_03715 [Patescibacteria group bacterium]|nr:hypothetical protein [Patescibacteria group bacterium]